MFFEAISMKNANQVSLPNVLKAFMKGADVLLVLNNGIAIPCHSQILSMHSALFCNMLADLPGLPNEKIKVPLADFTVEQCLVLLAYLYENGSSYKGPAFATHAAADLEAAIAVARFAHTYDVPHALRHVEVYLTAFMDAQSKAKKYGGMPRKS